MGKSLDEAVKEFEAKQRELRKQKRQARFKAWNKKRNAILKRLEPTVKAFNDDKPDKKKQNLDEWLNEIL